MSPTPKKRPAPKLDVAHLEAVFGRRLPESYRRFVSSGAYLRKNGWKVHGLPGFDAAWSLPVQFDAPTPRWELEEAGLGKEHKNDPLITVRFRDEAFYPKTKSKKPRPVPVATLKSKDFDGQEFLAIELGDPKGPVSLWQHGDGSFTRVADSFDAFLGMLLPPNAKSPLEALIDTYEAAHRVLRKDPKKAEQLLTKAVAPFAGVDPDEGDEVMNERLAAVHNAIGVAQIHQHRFKQAAASYERSKAFGSGNGALNLALTCSESLGDFARALAVTDEILADPLLRMELGRERASQVYATRGLSLLGLGKEKEARAAFALSEEFLQDVKEARVFAVDLDKHIVKAKLPLAPVAAELSARLKGIAKGTISPRKPKKSK